MFVVELNVFHFETATPLGLVPQTILKRAAGVLLSDEELELELELLRPGLGRQVSRLARRSSVQRAFAAVVWYRASSALNCATVGGRA